MTGTPVNNRTMDHAPNGAVPSKAASETAMVVLVPGLGLDARAWHAVRDGLTGESRVVLLPSMGQRAPRGTDLSVERQAERVLTAFPDGRGIILVGHSASCPVVVEAAAHSSHVVGLILIGPVTDPRAQSWPRMLSQWVRTVPHERPHEARTLLPQYRRTGTLSMLRGMNAVRRFRTDLALAQMAVPVEILRGQHDRIATYDWSSELRRRSDGRLTSVSGAAHMVPLTHAAAVIAAAERMHGVTQHPQTLWAGGSAAAATRAPGFDAF